jgi:predicted ATPase/class 3 adenylate cyclase
MAELPSGTVTFVFTDIEGSTRLLARLRDRYGEVLAEHQHALRGAFTAHGGREVHTEGDAFFVAFARATDAVAAAVAGQRALAAESWPDGVDVRVRMGVHTGEAAMWMDDYVGLDVHRAARICSAGHGGQVLVSSPTRELIEDELPNDVALRDLGEHWLKDLDRPEHLFQVVAGDLPRDFPPLASMSPGRGGVSRLPASPSPTIGRDGDVRAIAQRLGVGGVRLFTLTGPGGVGKTRLGLEAARAVRADFADGAHFVSLAALQKPEDVPAAIVKALAIVVLSGESADEAAERFLAAKHLLLVVDNFEHVLAAAPFIARLLAACPALTVVATSREPLRLHAEEHYPVSPLTLPEPATPEDVDMLASVDSVVLFCGRARVHDPSFDLDGATATPVAEICRRVDGLPLAIELAAARCGMLAPGEIAERLREALGALGTGPRDAPVRQHTLRATIDWSFELLNRAERDAFTAFAVFAGGATAQAAEMVTGAGLDTLERLVAKNLIVRHKHPHARTRLGMLETIRAYAAERLTAAADKEAVRDGHYRYFLAVAQRHATEQALSGADRNEHLAELDAENDNVHTALEWAVGQHSAQQALAMAGAISQYWRIRNRHADAVSWVDRALDIPGADAHPALCVQLLTIKAMALWSLGRVAEQPAVWAEAEAIARALGDPAVLSRTLQPRAVGETLAGREDAAEALAEEALRCATTAGDEWTIALAASGKAMAASNIDELRQRVDRASSLLAAVGNVYHLADMLASAAYSALCMGSDRDAKELLERAIPIARRLDDPSIWMLLRGNAGLAAVLTGDTDVARDEFREELRLCRELVDLPYASEGLRGLAAVAAVREDLHRAARLVGASAAHRYGQPYEAIEARFDTAFFEAARTCYGVEAWNAAADEGGSLSFEDAIAYALEEDGEDVRTHREAVT